MSDLRTKEKSPAKYILAGTFGLAAVVLVMAGLAHFGVLNLPNGNPQLDGHTGEIIKSDGSQQPTGESVDNGSSQPTENWQPPVFDNPSEQMICMINSDAFGLTAPTGDFPFGGYENYLTVKFTVKDNLWSAVNARVNADDECGILTDAEHQLLVLNLVNEARNQAGNDLNLTFTGQVIKIDMMMFPTRAGMVTPYEMPTPSGSVIEPDGNEANGNYDGSAHSTNPQLGTSAPQRTEASGGTFEGDPSVNSGNFGGNVEQQPSSRTSTESNLPPVVGEGIGPVLPQLNSLEDVPSAGNEFNIIHPFN